MPLDNVKKSLEENQNVDNDIKKKIYNLVELFVKKMPNIDLTKLCNNLKTFKFSKISKYEKCGVYRYDCINNEILFSYKLEEDYDIDHLLMKAILEMTTNTGKFTGFNSNDLLYALNLAYTEILANYIVGNEGDSDLEEEVLLTNMVSLIVGKDEMLNAYFSNNGDIIIKIMHQVEGIPFDPDLETESKTKGILDELNRINSAKYNQSLLPKELALVIISIGELFSNQLRNNTNKYPIDDFENWVPDFVYETKYYKHEELNEASTTVRETDSAFSFSYEERYKRK